MRIFGERSSRFSTSRGVSCVASSPMTASVGLTSKAKALDSISVSAPSRRHRNRRDVVALVAMPLAIAACASETPGYQKEEPGRVVCGCDYPDVCYEGAAKVARERGETDASGEEVLYYAQCACFMG